MKKTNTITHPADFDNAIFFAKPVTVWQQGEKIDDGGLIQYHDEIAVKINGSYFLKENCEFIIK